MSASALFEHPETGEVFDPAGDPDIEAANAFAASEEASDALIPVGIYCTGETGRCPFWAKTRALPDHLAGYCARLRRGDWSDHDRFGLLWDQVKECGLREGLSHEQELDRAALADKKDGAPA